MAASLKSHMFGRNLRQAERGFNLNVCECLALSQKSVRVLRDL